MRGRCTADRRAWSLSLALPAAALCAAVAGCGGKPVTPTVNLSLVAPTDGALVNVRAIEVLGRVDPSNARVVIAGRRVHVVNGTFRRPLVLGRRVTRIRIDASARGFIGSSMVVSVHYAARAASSFSARPATSPPASSYGGAGVSPTAAQTSAIDACSIETGNSSVCNCIFTQMSAAGFKTEAQYAALVAGWRRSFRSRGVIQYPPAMRHAIIACARQFAGH